MWGSVCRSFDKDHIDPAVMKKIQAYTPQPEFQPEKIEKVGVPTAGGQGGTGCIDLLECLGMYGLLLVVCRQPQRPRNILGMQGGRCSLASIHRDGITG